MNHRSISKLLGLFLSVAALKISAQGTAFMYQGQLDAGGVPANAPYDLRFALFDAVTNGNAIGNPQTNFAVSVVNGLFTTNIDFGPVFSGTNYWLSVGVRTNGSTNAFTLLYPRQPLLPVPYAIFATSASNLLGTLASAQLTGTVPSAQIAGNYLGAVNFSNQANAFSGSFFGNGLNVTNLNGSNIVSGTVADARLSANVALLNTNQTFTGTNNFVNASNAFNGYFAGNFSGNGAAVTNLNGSQIASGTVADARLSPNVALLNNNQAFSGSNTFNGTTTFNGSGAYNGVNNFGNAGNSFTGNFFGNGLVGWIPVSITATQAVRDHGYLLLSSSLTTVTLPASASLFPGDIIRISGAGSGGWQLAQNAGQYVSGLLYSPTNNSWAAASPGNAGWWAIASSSDGSKIVVAKGGVSQGIATSVDSGNSWTPSTASFAPSSLASSGDGTRLVGAVYNGGVIRSTDSGVSWNAITPGNVAWTGIASSADGSKFAACISNSTVYVWTGYGVYSNYTTALLNVPLTGIAASADCSHLAVCSTASIYTSADGGTNWTITTGPTGCSCIASSASGLNLVAAQASGSIYTSANGGGSWTKQVGAPSANWTAVACSADGERIVATAGNGGIYFSANLGMTWTPQPVANQAWRAVTCSGDGTKVYAAYATTLTTGGIDYEQALMQPTLSTIGVNGSVTGGPGTTMELQYIGSNQFMPISGLGTFWAN